MLTGPARVGGALALTGLLGCLSPHAYTSARPVEPGKVVGGLSYEPVAVFTKAVTYRIDERNRPFPATAIPIAGSLHLRTGISESCDVGFHLVLAVLPGADVKCTLHKSERFAIALMPRLQYFQAQREGALFIHGVALASLDIVDWFRVTPTLGLAGIAGDARLKFPEGTGNSGPLAGVYGRAGLGIEFHNDWFSFQPEFTYLLEMRELPLHGIFGGMAFQFGAIPSMAQAPQP